MTSFEPMIDGLRVESFRGFRDFREFDLSATAVVVTGPNGTGKTSFFDALQWGLLGRLERLEGLRARRNVEHIVNQYRLGHKASVEIDLRLESGSAIVRRTGDQGGSTLELRRTGEPPLFGDEAESVLQSILLPHTDLTLESALTTSGLMQQDVMRRVLEAKPSDRYRQLSTILGLRALEDFEDAIRSVAKQASEREKNASSERARLADALKQAEVRSLAAEARLAGRPQVAALRSETLEILVASPAGVLVNRDLVHLEGPEDVNQAAVAFGRAADRIESAQMLMSEALRLRAGLLQGPTEEQLNDLRDESARARVAKDASEALRGVAQGNLNAARQAAAEVAKLAALAVPMLSDHCPVCRQGIDRAVVERELRERAESTGTILQLEQEFKELHNQFSRDAAIAAEALARLDEAEQMAERWRQVHGVEEAAHAAMVDVNGDNEVVRFDHPHTESFVDFAGPALEYCRRVRRTLHDLLETFDRQSDQGAVERANAEARSLKTALASAAERLAAEAGRSKKLQALSEQTVEARVEVTEARLRSIQPLVANIYQRLDPHPAFKTVDFELDTYYRKGTTSPLVIDEIENVSADPLLIFSTSQANIVALSYFIAMSLSSGERGLPFLLLDDPVQSMDDVNVLGFADLCRHLRLRRQLIVSTHERRFASLLERKLAPRAEDSQTKVIRFTGWDRSGPTVNEYSVAPELLEDPIRLVKMAG